MKLPNDARDFSFKTRPVLIPVFTGVMGRLPFVLFIIRLSCSFRKHFCRKRDSLPDQRSSLNNPYARSIMIFSVNIRWYHLIPVSRHNG